MFLSLNSMDAERILQSYFGVSATALMIYDYVITLQREVEFVWPSPWSTVKVLFMLIRYMPFLDVLLDIYRLLASNFSPRQCLTAFLISRWLLVLGIAVAEVVLLIRTWVIWAKRTSILITLVITGLCASACATVAFALWTRSLLDVVQTAPLHQSRCTLLTGSSIVGLSLVAVIFFETVILVLTLSRLIQQFLHKGRALFWSAHLRVLYRDGILFFVYLFGISMINLIFVLTGPPASRDLLVVLQRVLHSSLTTRLLLNLREARMKDRVLPQTGPLPPGGHTEALSLQPGISL